MSEPEFSPLQLTELNFWIEQMGWESEHTFFDADYRIKAWRRQGEHLCLIWRGKRFAENESWFESPEVERIFVPDADAGVNALRTHVPTYDWTEYTDEAVLHYLSGKQITWTNSLTREPQTAVVPTATSTRMSHSRMGRQFITFADSSFRSVALDAIIEIR